MFYGPNWDNGEPDSTTDTQINNGGTAQISANAPMAEALSLTLGLNAGNSGSVEVIPFFGDLRIGEAIFVGYRGTGKLTQTLTGNATVSTTNGTTVDGTVSPKGGGTTLTIGGALQLTSGATTQCNVTPQDPSTTPQASVTGQVSLGGRLSVTMAGDFSSAPTRFTLLSAGSVNFAHQKFDSTSITYPTNQCWTPQITYVTDNNGQYHVYLDRIVCTN